MPSVNTQFFSKKCLVWFCPKCKSGTLLRGALPAQIKVKATLNFLATENSYRTLQYFFRVPKVWISKFVSEICDTIFDMLKRFNRFVHILKLGYKYFPNSLFFLHSHILQHTFLKPPMSFYYFYKLALLYFKGSHVHDTVLQTSLCLLPTTFVIFLFIFSIKHIH